MIEEPSSRGAGITDEGENLPVNANESMADDSAKILDTLDEATKRVFESLPIDKAVSIDALSALGIETGVAVTALTMLELCGLITSLPGGLYVRK